MSEDKKEPRHEHQIKQLPDGRFRVRYGTGKRGHRKSKVLDARIRTLQQAKKELERLRSSNRVERTSNPTVAQLCAEYIDLHEHKSASALVRAEGIIENHIKPDLGDIRAADLRLSDVLKWRKRRSEKDHASDGTLDREWNLLRAVLNFGVRSDLLDTMPIKRSAIPRLVSSADGRIIYFEPAEWDKFITALDDESRWRKHVEKTRRFGATKIAADIDTPRKYGAGRRPDSDATKEYRARLLAYRPIFTALLWTGARLGEILNLTWQDVDLRGGYVRLPQQKTSKPKTLPIATELRATLEAMARGVGKAYVFPRPDGRPHANLEAQRAFRVYRDVAGLREELTPHAIRHTFASWLVIQGVPIKAVQELLGHKTLAMTLRYAHLSPIHLKGAITALETMKKNAADETKKKETDQQ